MRKYLTDTARESLGKSTISSTTRRRGPIRSLIVSGLFHFDSHFHGLYSPCISQEDVPGLIHPNAVTVSIFSSQLDDADFNGFSEHSQSTSGLNEKRDQNGFTCCHQRFIQLDERASRAQYLTSLNFQLHCLTSFLRCKDDREILP
jgi:hypothetical protein